MRYFSDSLGDNLLIKLTAITLTQTYLFSLVGLAQSWGKGCMHKDLHTFSTIMVALMEDFIATYTPCLATLLANHATMNCLITGMSKWSIYLSGTYFLYLVSNTRQTMKMLVVQKDFSPSVSENFLKYWWWSLMPNDKFTLTMPFYYLSQERARLIMN